MPPKKIEAATTSADHEFKCLRCNAVHPNPSISFYKSRWSPKFEANDGYAPLCRKCVDELLDTFSRRYKDERKAVILICHYLDVYFSNALYDSVLEKNSGFVIGHYLRTLNGAQYNNKNFGTTILEGELNKTRENIEDEKEDKWPAVDRQNRDDTIDIVGYDPFEGYPAVDRRFLFSELVKYFGEDDLADDQYKLSQIIQIVINNNQIRRCDVRISQLDQVVDINEIKDLADLKSKIVTASNNIAKENEISVKNRSNKTVGKSTLTYLMREMRDKDIKEVETNFYEMLRSEGAQWAANQSLLAIRQNAMFDDNDVLDIVDNQRETIINQRAQIDDLLEKIRLLKLDNLRIATGETDGGDADG